MLHARAWAVTAAVLVTAAVAVLATVLLRSSADGPVTAAAVSERAAPSPDAAGDAPGDHAGGAGGPGAGDAPGAGSAAGAGTGSGADVTAGTTAAGDAAGAVRVRSARLRDLAPRDASVPVALTITGIGVDGAPVDPVGVEADGSMEIPRDVARVGWYEHGPAPGAPAGTAVLTAHVDDRTQGRGVFYDLDGVAAGDEVAVRMSAGTVQRFTVDEVRQVPKALLPTGDLFRRDGAPRLALITCGGTFDTATRHYRDNVVVLAAPAG